MKGLLSILTTILLLEACGKSSITVGTAPNDSSSTGSKLSNINPDAVNDSYDLRPAGSITFNVLSNDSDTDGTIAVSSIDSPTYGNLIDNGNGSYTYTADANYNGLVSLNYTIEDDQGGQSSAVLKLHILNSTEFTGRAQDGDWTNPNNWCGNITNDQCDGASAIPLSTDVIYFSGVCDQNCDASLNTDAQVYNYSGLKLAGDYSGTITLSGSNDFILNDEGYLQENGRLDASGLSGRFLISEYTYTKIGMELKGGKFIAGRNTEISISLTGTNSSNLIKIDEANYFDHNNGHFKIEFNNEWGKGPSAIYNLADQTTFYDLELNSGGSTSNKPYATITTASSIIVENDLTYNISSLKEGNIDLYGDLYLGSRPVNYSYQSTSSVKALITFKGDGDNKYDCVYSTTDNVGPPIAINKGAYSVTPNTGTTDCGFSGIEIISGTFNAPPGVLNIAPYLAYDNFDFYLLSTNTGTTFNHNGGHVYMQLMGGWLVDPNAKLYFSSSGISFNDLTIVNNMNSSYPQEIVADIGSGVLNVEGNLTIDQTNLTYLELPTVEVQGDVNISGNQNRIFDLILNGVNQSLNNTSTYPIATGNLILASSGTINVTSDLNMSSTDSDVNVNSGTVNLSGYDLDTNGDLTIDSGAIINMGGGTLSYGSLTNNGTLIP